MQPAAYHENDTAPIGDPRGMVSYCHQDEKETPVRLVQELRLRGVTMLRDLEHFRAGRSTNASMTDAISGNLVVAHLAEQALESTAVMDKELKPALRSYNETGKPLVVLVAHGLGETWDKVDDRIAGRLPAAISARWGKVYPESEPIAEEECAAIAAHAINSHFGAGRGPGDGCWELTLVTRGTPMPSPGLLVDATAIVGGREPRCGNAEEWTRIYAGIEDLAAALHAHGRRRRLDLTPQCHLTAAVAVGYAFRRACGWTMCVRDRGGVACDQGPLRVFDRFIVPPVEDGRAGDDRLFVELAVGRRIDRAVETLIAKTGVPHARLRIRLDDGADLAPEEMAPAAAAIADLIKRERERLGVQSVALLMAAPAALAALLGAELNALGAQLDLYEHAMDGYVPTLSLNAG